MDTAPTMAARPGSGFGLGLKQPYHLVDPSPWPIIGAPAAACC